jgi:aryl-alcohol dehydrogenase-like predicted oxidoreductase
MDKGNLGPLGPVSRLTLGGGGLGQLWGRTDRAECVATVRAAVDAGINLIDLAYRYGEGEAELVFGEAFAGRVPDGVRVTSKCLLGNTPAAEIEDRLRQSIHDSLTRLRLERLDLFFFAFERGAGRQSHAAAPECRCPDDRAGRFCHRRAALL